MRKLLSKFTLVVPGLFLLGLCGCGGGGTSNASTTSPSLHVSQNIPNLYLNQNWELKISSNDKLSEPIEVTVQSEYGVLVEPSKVILSPESPVATVDVSGYVICVSCKISATSDNYTAGYSNNFDVKSGQLPDYGGLTDLEVATGSYKIYAASTLGHIYRAQIDPLTESSTAWEQISTLIPDSSSILDMDYDRLTKNVYAITSSGNAYLSVGGTSDWGQLGGAVLPGNSVPYGSQIDESGNLFVATNSGFIYATSLSGSWQEIGKGKLPDGGVVTTEYGIYLVSVSDDAESIFVGSSKGNVYVANVNPDNLVSESWVHVGNSGITDEITAISVDSTTNPESGSIYAGTNRGSIYYSLGISGNWSKLGNDLGGNTSMIVIDQATSDVYTLMQYGAATFSAYYSLAPAFESWTNFGNILPESMSDGCTVKKIVTSFPGATLQFAGTNCGNVYFSTSGFTNWKPVGLPE
ncbi:MAG: hypothetical protein EKK54_12030 [Neisseriaceae bacterium]|nr:MAG: hypothetical protein EKK54_12030 [Neisseriaceae bacterium]